jgi:hypothetical protein
VAREAEECGRISHKAFDAQSGVTSVVFVHY